MDAQLLGNTLMRHLIIFL